MKIRRTMPQQGFRPVIQSFQITGGHYPVATRLIAPHVNMPINVNNFADLSTFLGTIDTVQEAAFLIWAHEDSRTRVDCQHGVRAVPGGYEVVTHYTSICEPGGKTTVWYADVSGSISERLSEPVTSHCDSDGVL